MIIFLKIFIYLCWIIHNFTAKNGNYREYRSLQKTSQENFERFRVLVITKNYRPNEVVAIPITKILSYPKSTFGLKFVTFQWTNSLFNMNILCRPPNRICSNKTLMGTKRQTSKLPTDYSDWIFFIYPGVRYQIHFSLVIKSL